MRSVTITPAPPVPRGSAKPGSRCATALPNAVGPALALLGLDVGALLGNGTVLVEVVFGLHGIGRLTYDALHSLDLAMVMACVLYSSVFVVLMNGAAEAAQALIGPRP